MSKIVIQPVLNTKISIGIQPIYFHKHNIATGQNMTP